MKTIITRFVIFFKRRQYFQERYDKMYCDAIAIHRCFEELCSTYLVDEDNIEKFGNMKQNIIFYTEGFYNKFKLLEEENTHVGELSRSTLKKREATINMVHEILKLCGK